MFGELIAVWLYGRWRDAGMPADAVFAEIGPGRGTMMKDVARTLAQIDPELTRSAKFALVEASERLRDVQREMLAGAGLDFVWHDNIDALPNGPLFIAGNELFDAIPARQFVRTQQGWCERVVGLDEHGGLVFMAGAVGIDPALLPPDAGDAEVGAIAELAPAREALMETICSRIAELGGAGLFIDYGHSESAVGDTLQAVRDHAFDDVLAHPGEADLTSHVDFEALATVARKHGLDTHLTTQAQFLLNHGLLERAGQLGATLDEDGRERIRQDVERLAGPRQMGELFKVMSVVAQNPANSGRSPAD